MFSHEKLQVYQRTTEWLAVSSVLDAMKILELGNSKEIEQGEKLLKDIASMLTALVFRWKA